MPSSGMLRRVGLVGTDVSDERSASIIRVRRIGELGTTTVTSNLRTPRRNTIISPGGRKGIPWAFVVSPLVLHVSMSYATSFAERNKTIREECIL
jgi:hypothetical protein